ncbi:uncharacterized protein CHSO_1639 [Chryseobacterium sp. StRB126]|uniref:DUF3592 domain-containing protein n=1 Tax=Chryseobacterium sp. StRB126 TaxID=878220 RepID=UPI0004E98896|nr:DUF3592 domain-containing protein [Chryseobacterium sp. StRB126]BAP30676.1 uncharacterized protein CHSO_1639 [Chryseobacterium sp. StRB126]
MKNNSFWVSLFSLVLMLLFLGFGGKGVYYSIAKFYKHTGLVLNGVKTEGHITSYTESRKQEKNKYTRFYSPIISYYDTANRSYTLNADYSSNSKEWSNEVTIYYDKAAPSKAIRGGLWHLWFSPFVVLCLSLIPLGLGLYLLKYSIRLMMGEKQQ